MKIAISRTDGGVSIMTIIGDSDVAESIEKWKDCHPDEYVSHRVIEDSDLPSDRATREGWVDSGASITVDPARLE